MKRLLQFAVAAGDGRGLHGPKPAAAVDLSGAWAISADECSNVFVRKGRAKQIELTHTVRPERGGSSLKSIISGVNLPAARSRLRSWMATP